MNSDRGFIPIGPLAFSKVVLALIRAISIFLLF
jgi:hypothetical protein